MPSSKQLIGLIIYWLAVSASYAQTQFNSGQHQAQMIELYTSEGCSSCPQADKWLSRFKTHPDLWGQIIPLAFHVDYWDYIGWKDRFAKKAYVQRQYLHRDQGNIKQVYTPGVVLNAKEWRGWYRGKKTLTEATQEVGVLSLTLDQQAFSAQFSPSESVNKKNNSAEILTIALLGFELKTPIKAGENKGELLNHDFVVLSMDSYAGINNRWQGVIPSIKSDLDNTATKAIVVWVSTLHSLKPLQATGGWLR
jgi:hypothetical protein